MFIFIDLYLVYYKKVFNTDEIDEKEKNKKTSIDILIKIKLRLI